MEDFILEKEQVEIADSKYAHAEDTILAALGHFKTAPVFGVGARRMIGGVYDKQGVLQQASVQLRAQKIEIQKIGFENGKIKIEYL